MSKRRNPDAAFKARAALGALKGARRESELASAYEIHQLKKALAVSSSVAAAVAEAAEDAVRDLHGKIKEMTGQPKTDCRNANGLEIAGSSRAVAGWAATS